LLSGSAGLAMAQVAPIQLSDLQAVGGAVENVVTVGDDLNILDGAAHGLEIAQLDRGDLRHSETRGAR
ncbi:MAG: hypothetical protein AAFY88_22640, partial [Acidobacteriota bacterium]